MSKKLILLLIITIISLWNFGLVNAWPERQAWYNELKSINIWTFNEYWYKITEQFFKLKQNFEVNWIIDSGIIKNIDTLAVTGYKYLPDNLNNKNYLSNLQSSLKKWIKYNNSDWVYTEIVKSIESYLYDTVIYKINWNIEVSPSSWNAPLNVTLRARVVDPSWTVIPKDNYIWWVDNAWIKKIIWKGTSINYTFNDEWKFSIFLDVLSTHRNSLKYTDVLPFSSRADITVNQKIANLNIKINDKDLRNQDTIKFSPDEAGYWVIFDATSSTSTSWTKFLKTTWDFWNWVKREYDWWPKVERVTYWAEWDYKVVLTLKTNELQIVERKFTISIHKPVATIKSSLDQWFIWDKFTFTANPSVFEKDLTYNWEIVDIDKNETILQKTWNAFPYVFTRKWKFNIKLKVMDPSGETDNDNMIIYINSRAPVAEFSYSIPKSNKPNRILFDATKSYDQDYTDDWKLEYSWLIDWQKIDLESPNYNWSLWYYTFDSIGDHSVVLEVTDPDSIKSQKNSKVNVSSILSVEFNAYPLVIQRNGYIKFLATSQNARFFKWDFGDGNIDGWSKEKVTHNYDKSWTFIVKLEVNDSEGNSNTFSKKVYVSDSNYPFALINVQYDNWFDVEYKENWCWWKWAYSIDRISNIRFNWQDSINIDWQNSWLSYSWKVWVNKFASSTTFSQKFDELGCFPVKLTVRSDKNSKTHTQETYVEVKNVLPSLSSLSLQSVNTTSDPVIVNVNAIGAKDLDWVILSYMWYYYTDSDSEPQDYRVTVNPTTTFVLPKISGTYYFVSILKDNNEEKYNSEDLWTKAYLSLTWDNINTPLVDLSVNDSSVSVEDEVIFTAKTRNILWQDLTDKATYSWDFDWDWFYDKETSGKWTISYKYPKSWIYYVKLKSKYKWISNVKTVTIDVVNNLTPDFDYISILNKYIFFNKSNWKYENIVWDLWDWTSKEWYNNFVYSYIDWKPTHEVILRITDWTKLKEIKKVVTKNAKNLIKANQNGLNIFSNPELNSSGKIVLDKANSKVFIYLWASKWDFSKYIIDYDINYDSDLNWWKEDDIDNKDTSSYSSWDPVSITLNDNKIQTIRIILKNSQDKLLEQKDIEIIKNYIKDVEKNVSDIVFSWVTVSEKQKIELLKNYISSFPPDLKVTGMKYLERLQWEWFDNTEKTKVILEFEWFLDNPEITNSTDIINLLESLLVEWQADQTQKWVSFNALKNLLREEVKCEFDTKSFQNCKEYLVSLLETIRDENDLEKNKELSKIILQVVLDDETMSDKEKLDFKEILKGLLYWPEWDEGAWDTNWIDNWESTSIFSSIVWFFKWTAWFILATIAIIVILLIWYWIFFKFSNKDWNKWFEEFIIEKSSQDDDILTWLSDEVKVEDEKIQNNVETNKFEMNQEETKEVPEWLKSSFTQTWNEDILSTGAELNVEPEIKNEEAIQNDSIQTIDEKPVVLENENNEIDSIAQKTETEIIEPSIPKSSDSLDVPDWLKWSIKNNESTKDESSQEKLEDEIILDPENENPDELIKIDSESDLEKKEKQDFPIIEDKDFNTPVIVDSNNEDNSLQVPDWLKGSLDQWKNDSEKWNTKTDKNNAKFSKEKVDDSAKNLMDLSEIDSDEKSLDELTKIDESVIPDWLRGSLNEEKTIKKEVKPKSKAKGKTEDKKTEETAKTWNELWQDGMKVPDWLDDKQDNQNKK